MGNIFRRLKNERGQALLIVLALLGVGSLMVVPTIGYAQATLNHNQIIQKGTNGVYAADAGVEYALWALKYGQPLPTTTPTNINGMSVSITTQENGYATLYLGQIILVEGHGDYVRVTSSISWDSGAGAYNYTITVRWQPDSGSPTIHLTEVGARLPAGYTYVTGSAGSFASNLSLSEPVLILDSMGTQLANWTFSQPLPSVSQSNQTATQSFYMTGPSQQDGYYSWAVVARSDVNESGEVGEVSGIMYRIVATATDPSSGAVAGRVTSDVIDSGSTQYILLWRTRDEN